jgi:hypothetical protein
MGKIYGMSKEELDAIKDKGKSVLELQNIMFASEVDKAKRPNEEVTTRSASTNTLANDKHQMALLEQHGTQKATEPLHWGL